MVSIINRFHQQVVIIIPTIKQSLQFNLYQVLFEGVAAE